MPSITARMQGLSLDEPVQSATTPQLDDAQPKPRRYYRRTHHNPARVNSRPFPTSEECRAARRNCMYYGFYAGELALEKMIIKLFPDELEGRDPDDVNLFLAALQFIRKLTGRADICVHGAYVAQRNKEAIPSMNMEVGEVTDILGLFPLEREAYMHRPLQEDVDMLAEFLGTKPSWWEISAFSEL